MSESRISNWCLAISEHIPGEIDELHAEVAELDRRKAEKLALIADYTELLTVARRRFPAVKAVPTHPFMGETVAA